MSDADRITLVDVLVNHKLSNTDSKTHSDMGAFYLSERKGREDEQAPDREYYFVRRYRTEHPDSVHEVIAPGFNSQWNCIGTLIPNNPDSFSLSPFRFEGFGVSSYFETPPFGTLYGGLSKACRHHLDRYPLQNRPCHFIDDSYLFSLGEDASTFVRRLFAEVPDQDDERGMRQMIDHLIMNQLIYTLDASLMPESAPWFSSMFRT